MLAGYIFRRGGLEGAALKRARLRVRHSLARYAANHGFPFAGDGMVILKGQAPTRGWLGSRWKQRFRQHAPS